MGETFNEEEMQRILAAFQHIDRDNDGLLTKKEFLEIKELKQNPLVGRVLSVFDIDGNDCVDFKEFITALSVFCGTGEENVREKLNFAFQIYDVNSDGYISNGDLFHVLKIMVGDNLGDEALQQLVDRTILQADQDGDGKISYEEFA